MARAIRFENLKRPALRVALSDLEVEGLRLDLHRSLRMVGLTYGIDPTTVTLGWAAVEVCQVVRQGRAIPISGLALHAAEVSRFELSFQDAPPGQLEYFEMRVEAGAGGEPEAILLFFFEGGTIRLSCEVLRAELVTELDEDYGGDPGKSSDPGPNPGTNMVQ